MVKKIIKYVVRILLIVLMILILIPALLYIPYVQDFLKKQAVSYVSRKFDMQLSVERIRLSYPLTLKIDNTLLADGTDTLLECGRLAVDVALWPLLKKEVVVREFALSRTIAHYADSLSGLDLRANIGMLKFKADKVDLSKQEADIPTIELLDGTVNLSIGESGQKSDTTASATPRWKINVKKLETNNLIFKMRTSAPLSDLSADLKQGTVEDCTVDLGRCEISVKSVLLQEGKYAYLTGHSDNDTQSSEIKNDTVDKSQTWIVRAGRVDLKNNNLTYGSLHHLPESGFDPQYINLSDVNLSVDSLYNKGADIAVGIGNISAKERSGMSVTGLSGRFSMDSAAITLMDFRVFTPLSQVTADVRAGVSVLRQDPAAPVDVRLSAQVNSSDLHYLIPDLNRALWALKINFNIRISGVLGDLNQVKAELNVPQHVQLSVQGNVRSLLARDRMDAAVRMNGSFTNLGFLKALIPDTSLRKRVDIPGRISLHGIAGLRQNNLSLSQFRLEADSGTVSVKGNYNLKLQRYDADIRIDSFPVGRFLPADSLGRLTLALSAKGQGFDPFHSRTSADVLLDLARMDFRGYDYGGLSLNARLADHKLSAKLTDDNDALRLGLDIEGDLTREKQSVHIFGDISGYDLYKMRLTSERIGGSVALDLRASATPEQAYTLNLALDSILIRNKWKTDRIRPTSLAVATDRLHSGITLKSGDMQLEFNAPLSADSLIRGIVRSSDSLARQFRAENIDAEALKEAFPSFRLKVTAGQNNILNNYLKTQGVSFKNLNIRSANADSLPVSTRITVEGLSAGSILLDTVTTGIRQDGKSIRYYLRLANAPGNMDEVALIAVYGHAEQNKIGMNFLQRNRAGKEGFNFGLDALWADSVIRVKMVPEHPTLGFEKWTVNPDNYFSYAFNRSMKADMTLTQGNQRFVLKSVPDSDSTSGIHLEIGGIDIGTTLSLFPAAPPFDGTLNTGVTLNLADGRVNAHGDIAVAGLSYGKQRLGDIALALEYRLDETKKQFVNAGLSIDGKEALSVNGDYAGTEESPVDLVLKIPALPLAPANAFLPKDMADISGSLQGEITASGQPAHLALNGYFQFADTKVRVPMIGTSFGISSGKIEITDNKVHFNNYAITAPNKNPLTVNGTVALGDFKNIMADLTLNASDFQLINVSRNRGSAVYGEAYLDLNASARGPLGELTVRGDASLLGGTNINYIMQDSPLEVKEKPQNIVTFVSFNDTTAVSAADTMQTVKIGGMDLLFNININNDVKMAVDLSSDGENRVDLQGGGNLTYTMNPLGDTRLSGKYVVSGGTVRYNPPVISEKIFKITQGSYVDWIGNIADPNLNITAVETVRATISTDGQNSRQVNFNISISMKNTLDNLSVTFGLSAPEDLSLQNQLNSLTDEQRATQAMNLLIYNAYSGPGTTAKVNSSNPLNSFIQKELNQWAQNSLKGVDLSFGIDSYDETDVRGQRTDYSYKLSKNLFNNRVRAVIGGKFSSDTDADQNLKENLIDDISLEYMLTKRDNMFLKLFRHTGYESILEGEITETGVGFVVRKKLLKLTDLFKIMRNSAKKKEAQNETANP